MFCYRSADAYLRRCTVAAAAVRRLHRCNSVRGLSPVNNIRSCCAPMYDAAILRVSKRPHVDSYSSFTNKARVPFASHALMKTNYYDAPTKTCQLCQEVLRGSYKAHTSDIMHIAQGVIVLVASQVMEDYLQQVQQRCSAAATSSPDSHTRVSAESRTTARTDGMKSHPRTIRREPTALRHSTMKSSALFVPLRELPGLPSIAQLAQNPSALRRLDLTSAVMRGWWNALHAMPSTSTARAVATSCGGAKSTVAQPLASQQDEHQEARWLGSGVLAEESKTSSSPPSEDRTELLPSSSSPSQMKSHPLYLDFLSAPQPQRRRSRLRFLLLYLKECGVIGTSLQASSAASRNARTPAVELFHENNAAASSGGGGSSGFARNNRFDTYEVYGDSLIKVLTHDYLNRVIASTTSENMYCINLVQRLIDSNAGLRAIYDYLGLNDIVHASLADNKSKSDVVESLLGELQMVLVASQTYHGTVAFPSSFCRGEQYTSAIVEHVLHEMVRCALMWRFQRALEGAQSFIAKELNIEEVSRVLQMLQSRCDDVHDRYDVLPKLRRYGAYRHPSTMNKHAAPHEYGHLRDTAVAGIPICLHLHDRATSALRRPCDRGQCEPAAQAADGNAKANSDTDSISSLSVCTRNRTEVIVQVKDDSERAHVWTCSPLIVVQQRGVYDKTLSQCAAQVVHSGRDASYDNTQDEDEAGGRPDRRRARGGSHVHRVSSASRCSSVAKPLSASWQESERLNMLRQQLYKKVRHMHLNRPAISTLLGQRIDDLVYEARTDHASHVRDNINSHNAFMLASKPSPRPPQRGGSCATARVRPDR